MRLMYKNLNMELKIKRTTYVIETEKIKSDNEYDTVITIKRLNKEFPIWGALIKSTDDVIEASKKIIQTWTK